MANTSMSVIFSLIVLVGVGAIAQTTPGSGQAASTTSASPSSKIGVFVYPQKNQSPIPQGRHRVRKDTKAKVPSTLTPGEFIS